MLDESVALVDGPWTHRDINANGMRFHAAEAGSGPLVVLLHGFPEFWWCWRHQITALADAGHRVVVPDLRGYGASDKPPRGYDLYTLSADIAGMVRSLGEDSATIVGHDWGGLIGWVTTALHPRVVRSLVAVSIPHPLRMRTALARDRAGQLKASRYLAAFQQPGYDRRLKAEGAAKVGRLMATWSGPTWTTSEDFTNAVTRYRDAMGIPQVAFCALEYYRWAVRANARPSGWHLAKLLSTPVMAPTLQLHGALDPCILPSTAQGSDAYVAGRYEWQLLGGSGHFPHEEQPDEVTAHLLRWLASVGDAEATS